MKAIRIGLAIAIFAITINTIKAQVSIGAKGGASLTKTMGSGFIQNYTGELNYIVSGNGAVYLEMPIAGNLSFRPEIGYTQTGAGASLGTSFNITGVDMPIGGTVRQRLTYLQAAPMLKYEFGNEESAVKPYIILGPTLNYMVDAKLVTRADLIIFRSQPYRIDLPLGTFNQFQVGGAGGLGLSFDLGNSKVFIEGRYERGFTRVYDVPVLRVPVHNQSFSFMAGFSIPFGRR